VGSVARKGPDSPSRVSPSPRSSAPISVVDTKALEALSALNQSQQSLIQELQAAQTHLKEELAASRSEYTSLRETHEMMLKVCAAYNAMRNNILTVTGI